MFFEVGWHSLELAHAAQRLQKAPIERLSPEDWKSQGFQLGLLRSPLTDFARSTSHENNEFFGSVILASKQIGFVYGKRLDTLITI